MFVGFGAVVSTLQAAALNGFTVALFLLFLLFLLRVVLRNELIAGTVWTVVVAATALTSSIRNAELESIASTALPALVWGVVQYFVVTRIGWLAYLWAQFIVIALAFYPLTFQASAWYASTGYTTLFLVGVVTGFGFWTSVRRTESDAIPRRREAA